MATERIETAYGGFSSAGGGTVSMEKVTSVNSDLKFLSFIRKGEKINTKSLFVRDNDSLVQRAIRSLRNFSTFVSMSETVESKEATLEYIQSTVNTAIGLISFFRTDKTNQFHQDIANTIVKNLENSKTGIQNLFYTYQNDRRFIAMAESVMQSLEVRLASLKTKGYLPGYTDVSFIPALDPDAAIAANPALAANTALASSENNSGS